jgi:hypothetical protein
MYIDEKMLAEFTEAILHKLYLLYCEGMISYETYLQNIEIKMKFLNDYNNRNNSCPIQ